MAEPLACGRRLYARYNCSSTKENEATDDYCHPITPIHPAREHHKPDTSNCHDGKGSCDIAKKSALKPAQRRYNWPRALGIDGLCPGRLRAQARKTNGSRKFIRPHNFYLRTGCDRRLRIAATYSCVSRIRGTPPARMTRPGPAL